MSPILAPITTNHHPLASPIVPCAAAAFPLYYNSLHSAHSSMPAMFPHSLIQQVTFAAAATSASPSSTASSPTQQQQQQQIGQTTASAASSLADTKPSAAELLAQAQLDSVAVAALGLGGIGTAGGDQSPQQMLAATNGNGGTGGQREPKPFKCPQCPKAFANNSYLSQHMRIHLGIRAFGPCQFCGKKFTQLSHLQQHIRTHTGEKPYKCKFANCEKAFSQLSNLQSHSRCHQADRPFKCNSCYKCFPDEQALLEHIPRHKESKHLKVHICPFCGKSYSQALYLDKHMTKHTDRRGGGGGATDMRFTAKDYYTNGTTAATMAAGNLMNGTAAAGLLLDGFDPFDGLVGTHLGQLGQQHLQNNNNNNAANGNNAAANGTDTLKHFQMAMQTQQQRQPPNNNNNNVAASAAAAAALSSAAAAGYGAATIGGYAGGMTTGGTGGAGGGLVASTTASGTICNPFGTAMANNNAAGGTAAAANNVQMAIGNSAAFNLFQRSFQQQQQQQQQNGTIGGAARGFNMITPLENIKHFNSSQQSGGQTANFH